MYINDRGVCEGEVASHSTHEASDNRCLVKDDEKKKEIPPETLQVYLRRGNVLGTFLEHLNKRYKSLDLIAVMMELKRTVQLKPYRYYHSYSSDDSDSDDGGWNWQDSVEIHENPSCLPRLQKME